jgi:hypothetical protein
MRLGWAPALRAPGSIALRATEAAERFPPSRVTIPWLKMWYHFWMTEFDSLQERVDAIRAAGDIELAFRAYRALSKALFEFTREKTGRIGPNVPIIQRVNVTDVEYLLFELRESKRSG